MPQRQHAPNGCFQRTRKIWNPQEWDNGYLDNKRRFRVYRPDCPRAYKSGYALRTHVVWWLHYGQPHPKDTEIHHIDGTRDNDHIENLVVLTNSEHQKTHKANEVKLVCQCCQKSFFVKAYRLRQRTIRFCSQKCYHQFPRSLFHKQAISVGLARAYQEHRR